MLSRRILFIGTFGAPFQILFLQRHLSALSLYLMRVFFNVNMAFMLRPMQEVVVIVDVYGLLARSNQKIDSDNIL